VFEKTLRFAFRNAISASISSTREEILKQLHAWPTDIASNVAIEPGKHHIAVTELFCCAWSNDKLTELLRHWPRLLPFYGILVLFPGRPFGSSNRMEGEVWVQGEQEDEPLSYGTRGSKDAYRSLTQPFCLNRLRKRHSAVTNRTSSSGSFDYVM
jgi:hypothetical protein